MAIRSCQTRQDTKKGSLQLPGGVLGSPAHCGGVQSCIRAEKVPCLAQNLSGFLEIAADADLTLCTAGRGTDGKAVCYSGEGLTGGALEPLVLDGEAESHSSHSCVRGTCCTGALPEVVISGSVTKSIFTTGLSV